jgi:hypothetical protein
MGSFVPPSQVTAIISFVSLQFGREQNVRNDFDRMGSEMARMMLEVVTFKAEIYEAEMKKFHAAKPGVKAEGIPNGTSAE